MLFKERRVLNYNEIIKQIITLSAPYSVKRRKDKETQKIDKKEEKIYFEEIPSNFLSRQHSTCEHDPAFISFTKSTEDLRSNGNLEWRDSFLSRSNSFTGFFLEKQNEGLDRET